MPSGVRFPRAGRPILFRYLYALNKNVFFGLLPPARIISRNHSKPESQKKSKSQEKDIVVVDTALALQIRT